MRPEMAVAAEIAQYLYERNRHLLPQYQHLHSLANLTWRVLERRWGDVLEDSPSRVRDDIGRLFDAIRENLPRMATGWAADLFNELTEQQKKVLVSNLLGRGMDIGKLSELKQSGEFLSYIDEESVVAIYCKVPELFFDGAFWATRYQNVPDLRPPSCWITSGASAKAISIASKIARSS